MGNEHPIDGLMSSAMNSIKEMVDVNTIIGTPVNVPDGTVIIPISRVSFGFAAGGSEFTTKETKEVKMPFGGGSGAGVTINPVGFLVVGNGQVKFISTDQSSAADKLVEYVPEAIEKIQGIFKKDNKEKKRYENPNGAVYVAEDIE